MRILGFGLVLASLAGARAGAEPKGDVPRAAVVVTIENFRFSPAEVTVPAGSVVKWVNKDDVPHTATAKGKDPAFDSRTLDTDEGFSFEFKKGGGLQLLLQSASPYDGESHRQVTIPKEGRGHCSHGLRTRRNPFV